METENGSVPEWLSTRDLAGRLDVRVAHLRALVSRGVIPFAKVGRLVRFHWPTIEEWLRGPSRNAPKHSFPVPNGR